MRLSVLKFASILTVVCQAALLSAYAETPQFKDITSVDVDTTTHPHIQEQTPGAEVTFAIVKELKNHPLLPYQSPNNAVLTLRCKSFGYGIECNKIVAKITLRSAGGNPNLPPLWEHEESVFKYKKIPYFKRDDTEIGEAIAKSLLTDYAAAQPAFVNISNPQRIEPSAP